MQGERATWEAWTRGTLRDEGEAVSDQSQIPATAAPAPLPAPPTALETTSLRAIVHAISPRPTRRHPLVALRHALGDLCQTMSALGVVRGARALTRAAPRRVRLEVVAGATEKGNAKATQERE